MSSLSEVYGAQLTTHNSHSVSLYHQLWNKWGIDLAEWSLHFSLMPTWLQQPPHPWCLTKETVPPLVSATEDLDGKFQSIGFFMYLFITDQSNWPFTFTLITLKSTHICRSVRRLSLIVPEELKINLHKPAANYLWRLCIFWVVYHTWRVYICNYFGFKCENTTFSEEVCSAPWVMKFRSVMLAGCREVCKTFGSKQAFDCRCNCNWARRGLSKPKPKPNLTWIRRL